MIISIVITIIVIIVIVIVIFAVKKMNFFSDKESRNLGFVSIKSLHWAALVLALLLFEHPQTFDSAVCYINLSFLIIYILGPYLLIDHPS